MFDAEKHGSLKNLSEVEDMEEQFIGIQRSCDFLWLLIYIEHEEGEGFVAKPLPYKSIPHSLEIHQ